MKVLNNSNSQLSEVLLRKYAQNREDIKFCPSNQCNYFGIISIKDEKNCQELYECNKCQTRWKDKN